MSDKKDEGYRPLFRYANNEAVHYHAYEAVEGSYLKTLPRILGDHFMPCTLTEVAKATLSGQLERQTVYGEPMF